jgi:hypothetical protein
MSVRPESRRRPGANERPQEESGGFTRGNPMAAIFLGLIIGGVLGCGLYFALKPAPKAAAVVQAKGIPQAVRLPVCSIIDGSTETLVTLPNRFGPEAKPGLKAVLDFTGANAPTARALIRLRLFALSSNTEEAQTAVITVKDAAGQVLGSGKLTKVGSWFDITLSSLVPTADKKIRLVLSSTAKVMICAIAADSNLVDRANDFTPYIEVTYP